MPAEVPSPSAPVSRPARSERLRVAVLGAGTVGREVVRAFVERPERLAVDATPALELAAVAVRDLDAARAAGIPDELLTDAPAHLVADPGVDVVVELMGGDEPARTLIEAALGAGRAVVTANKHVIAHHGARLEAAARAHGAALRFEAAVGGGIPVLGPLATDLAAGGVVRVRGIVNGTTNHILSEMAAGGRAYDDVLAEAQAAGYAEADPTADVEGFDAANKLAILVRLAFGEWIDPEAIQRRVGPAGRPGITAVRAEDIAAAAALDGALRLVADASRHDPGASIRASVLPTFVPLADPLGRVTGVTNRIEILSEPLGGVAFSGPGAGGPATASAVVADLRAIARGAGSTWAGLPAAGEAAPGRLQPPPATAPDRGWFVVLPGHARQGSGVPAPGSVLRSAATAHGQAMLIADVALDDVAAFVAAAVGEPAQAAIYPADLAGRDHRR